MKKVLITGATGFIGHHIVKANVAMGNQEALLGYIGKERPVYR